MYIILIFFFNYPGIGIIWNGLNDITSTFLTDVAVLTPEGASHPVKQQGDEGDW